ncbi:hypothetical protein [Nocardia cyriacigeorgica]|uniref:hypothetical protein n=1 Tax=Nocardia cyriacigeorgica TaxID=135487 RepID=UPI002453C09D|nr:hypothetical protein [Nocardia cyriacigeorgica]
MDEDLRNAAANDLKKLYEISDSGAVNWQQLDGLDKLRDFFGHLLGGNLPESDQLYRLLVAIDDHARNHPTKQAEKAARPESTKSKIVQAVGVMIRLHDWNFAELGKRRGQAADLIEYDGSTMQDKPGRNLPRYRKIYIRYIEESLTSGETRPMILAAVSSSVQPAQLQSEELSLTALPAPVEEASAPDDDWLTLLRPRYDEADEVDSEETVRVAFPDANDADVYHLVLLLHFNPALSKCVCAYLCTKKIPVARACEIIETDPSVFLDAIARHAGLPILTRQLRQMVNKLQEENPRALDALDLIAFTYHSNIPADYVMSYLTGRHYITRETIEYGLLVYDDAISPLLDVSWIDRRRMVLHVNPLVQAVLRDARKARADEIWKRYSKCAVDFNATEDVRALLLAGWSPFAVAHRSVAQMMTAVRLHPQLQEKDASKVESVIGGTWLLFAKEFSRRTLQVVLSYSYLLRAVDMLEWIENNPTKDLEGSDKENFWFDPRRFIDIYSLDFSNVDYLAESGGVFISRSREFFRNISEYEDGNGSRDGLRAMRFLSGHFDDLIETRVGLLSFSAFLSEFNQVCPYPYAAGGMHSQSTTEVLSIAPNSKDSLPK